MNPWSFVLHLSNFLLPAVVVAALLTPFVMGWRRWGLTGARGRQCLRVWGGLSLVGVVALVLGLVLLGRDGKMLSYASLVLAMGSAAFWWRQR